MELYILKSAACLSIFFLFYKLVLENTSFHTSKRIYLLGALFVSFIIPFITFTNYVEMAPMTTEVLTSFPVDTGISAEIEVEKTNYIPFILWTVYGLGVLFFGIKFSRNLLHILRKIKNNPSIQRAAFYDVLTAEHTAPHTFFNRLFFNRKSYEAKEFPQEVFWHEEAHASQKHSADLLLIELLQVVFWFNPLCYFFKGAIKLNHEFLADREVLHKTNDTAQYQHILLTFSTPDHLRGQGLISFANSINYSSIKKRFTVMKTHTSKRAGLLKGLLLLPLLAVLIYGFSTTQEVIKVESNSDIASENLPLTKDNISANKQEHLTARSISIKILDTNFIEVEGVKTAKENLYSVLGSLHTDITKKQRDRIINIHVSAVGDITYGDLLFIQKVAKTYGYHRIVTPKEEIIRSKGNVPMAPETEMIAHKDYAREYILGAAKDSIKTFLLQIEISELTLNGRPVKLKNFAKALDKYTKDWEETDYTSTHPNVLVAATPKSFLDKVDVEFRKTHFSKANGGIGIVPPPPPPPPLPLTAPRINKGAPSDIPAPPAPPSSIVRKGETSSIAPPPPPPLDMGDVKNKYEYSYVLYVNGTSIYLDGKKVALSNFAEAMDEHTKDWPASAYKFYGVSTKREHVSEEFITKLNKEYQKTKLAKKSSRKEPYIFNPEELEPPAPPLPPTNPLDHVIKMAKQNATFYYNGKRITSDKAIALVRANKELNINIQNDKKSNPIVKITDAPIQL